MPIWEVHARMKIESRVWKKSLDPLSEQLPQQNGRNNEKNNNFQDIPEDYEEDDDDEGYGVDSPHFSCIPTITEKKNPCYPYLGLLSRFPLIKQVPRKNPKKKHNSTF